MMDYKKGGLKSSSIKFWTNVLWHTAVFNDRQVASVSAILCVVLYSLFLMFIASTNEVVDVVLVLVWKWYNHTGLLSFLRCWGITMCFNPMMFFNAGFPESSDSLLVFIVMQPSYDNNYVCVHRGKMSLQQVDTAPFPLDLLHHIITKQLEQDTALVICLSWSSIYWVPSPNSGKCALPPSAELSEILQHPMVITFI